MCPWRFKARSTNVAGSVADRACAPVNCVSYLRRALGASKEGSWASTVAPWLSATCVVPWPANFSTLVIRITRSFSSMAIPLGCRSMATPPDPSAPAGPEQASFGNRDVPAADKAGLVREVFESVAPRYDLMNDLMSGGVHRLWKNTLVDVLHPRPGERFLDVAGGTGDVAFRILRRQMEREGARPDVTVCDVNAAMLAVGRDRAADRGLLQGLAWTTGDAENLPFPDRSFDGYT